MATPGHHVGNNASPDTPITIKISVNDSLKKLKLPLKDLGANVLIDKLRHCLNIKPEQHAVFERFSDSAGGYIVLESNNPQVFKTLIRAAKAKSKLRLKATVTPDLTEKKPEEVASSEDTSTMPTEKTAEPVIVRSPDNQTPSRDSTALDGRSIGSGIFQFREARASQQTLVEPEAPVPQPFPADRSDFFNSIASAGMQAPRELAFRSREPAVIPVAPAQGQWSVYCNSCDAAMYNAHYHCSICDGGDYDLCEACISSGTLCPGEGHWLIKRCIEDGKVVTSTTERIGRKAEKGIEKEVSVARTYGGEETKSRMPTVEEALKMMDEPRMPTRTCNNCVYVLSEDQFVTCKTCEDFDLCVSCHRENKHGHHPAHGFAPATDNVCLSMNEEAALAPGRHVRHNAICDGCDETIYGIRHKCLDCPDWDYCTTCVAHASLKHARHRFTAIYNPIAEPQPVFTRHAGIYCDGPLCKNKAVPSYIMGTRFKCAVCHDTDFCASCEALPGNHHNRTHPLIKFKTPVKNVSITTMNEDARGHVRNMGDRNIGSSFQSLPQAPKVVANAPSEVKTVAEFKPEIKQEEKQVTQPIPVVDTLPKSDVSSGLKLNTPATLLSAAFVSDSIPDGMAIAPGARFTQIWTLKNDGAYPWPAGCSVRYVGGDNMLNVDNGHPASVTDINEATESNVVGREVQVGESSAFKVVLKAPLREGKAISYWRVKAPDGTPFGHRLWCDIQVKTPEPQSSMPPKLSLYNGSLAQAQQQQQFQQKLMQQHMQHQQLQQAQQAQQAQEQQRQSMQSYLASQQRLQLINQQREAAMRREMARHGYQGYNANNNANFSHPTTQVPATQELFTSSPPADHTARKENANKEIAKLRVEQIKAKIMKQRADKYKSDAKAARAAADNKSAEEDAKVKKIIEAVTKTEDEETEDLATSQMVFPKLEKESPASSIIQSSSGSSKGKTAYVEDEEAENTTTVIPVETAPSVSSPGTVALGDDFEDFDDLEVLSANEVDSNDGFLTDEEYDILDASDQETVASK